MTTVYDPRAWAWQEHAGCRNWPTPEDFTTADPYRLTPGNVAALRQCRTACPVRSECFEATSGKDRRERKRIVGGGVLWSVAGRPLRVIPPQLPPVTGPPPRPRSPHGSVGAYKRHLKNREPVCDVCQDGHTARRLDRIRGDIPPAALSRLPAQVLAHRKALRLGRQAAARQMSISLTSLYLFETGQRMPYRKTLNKIVAWLPETEQPTWKPPTTTGGDSPPNSGHVTSPEARSGLL